MVAADCRRRGVGRRLIEAISDWFLAHGADEIRLSAAVRNEASNAFYRSLGFEPLTCTMIKRLR